VADGRTDAVLITAPPRSHRDLALAALAAGKHVLVEKPAFLDAAEFDAVEAAAATHGRQVVPLENYPYKPLVGALRRIIDDGSLGRLRLIQIQAVKRQPVDGWRVDPAESGGGALFEGGIHWISLMTRLGLEVRGVHGTFAGSPPGWERTAVVTLDYAEGVAGVLTYSWEIPGTFRGLRLSRLWGTRGSALFESNGLFLLVRRRRLVRPVRLGIRDIQGTRAMTADWVGALTAGRPPRYTLHDARRDVELVRAAYGRAPSFTS
jgi:predicted dehydrogenase